MCISVKEVFKDNKEVIGALKQQCLVPSADTFIASLHLFQLPGPKECIMHPTYMGPVFVYIITGRAVDVSLVRVCFTEVRVLLRDPSRNCRDRYSCLCEGMLLDCTGSSRRIEGQ